MNSIDIIILIVIGAGFVFGLFKGLIKELASLVAIFLGIYAAKLFAGILAPLLSNYLHLSIKIAQPLAYVVSFLAIVILLLMVARMVDKLFDSIALGGLNKLLGGFFGALKYALIISIILNVLNPINQRFRIIDEELRSSSFSYQVVLDLAPVLWDEAKQYKPNNEEKQTEQ